MKRIIAWILCAAILAGLLSVPIFAEEDANLTAPEWDLLLLANRERIEADLPPVTCTPSLQSACDIRVEEIATLFSHTRPNGSGFDSALAEVGLTAQHLSAENIAAFFADAAAVTKGWMDSEEQKLKILNPHFVHMGAGHLLNQKSYWMQMFYTTSDCRYTSMRLMDSDTISPACKSIEDARLTLELTCACGESSYLPLMQEFCTVFIPGRPGTQTIRVTCLGMEEDFSVCVAQMDDVPESAWYTPAVNYVLEKGLFAGTSGNLFSPNEPMTRAMLVTVLYRFDGSPEVGSVPFVDVAENQWFTDAVAWAFHTGVVYGTGDGKFSPAANLRREQLATILYRYCGTRGYDIFASADLSSYPDADEISAYASNAMRWAVGAGLLNGTTENGSVYLRPKGTATRAQVAVILMRFCETIAK